MVTMKAQIGRLCTKRLHRTGFGQRIDECGCDSVAQWWNRDCASPSDSRFPPEERRSSDKPGVAVSGVSSGRRMEEKAAARESTIRVDTARLDQVLNLSGEIGLTKNRLTSLRADILAGRNDSDTLHALDPGGEPARSSRFGSAELRDEDPDAADWTFVPDG